MEILQHSTIFDAPRSYLKFGTGMNFIGEYTFPYSVIETSIIGIYQTVFPRIGYLVFNLFTGKDYRCRFLNYSKSIGQINILYITGLLSENSLCFEQQGSGRGYAAKIHPVIGYHFLKIPMTEITERQVRISNVLEKEGSSLRALEENEIITSLDNSYLKKELINILPPRKVYLNDPMYHAVNYIRDNSGHVGIKGLSAKFCMSERNFNRQFLLKVGLSAQAYCKIWQLVHVINYIRKNRGLSLSEIAFKTGYYDVAHLAHDFKNKVSLSPTSFRQDMEPIIENYFDFPENFG